MKKYFVKSILIFCVIVTNHSIAVDQSETMVMRINKQLKADGRDKYDVAKDPGRKPVETLNFFGVKSGMTVLDVITGAGYNAEILSAAVGSGGIVYAQNTHFVLTLIDGAHHKAMLGRLENKRLSNVRYMVVDIADMPFEESIDLAVWGFNMHDIYNRDGEAATVQFLSDIKRALKPGGILGISEHIGVAGNDNAELHRLETSIVSDMLNKSGFVIEETSDLLSNPNDDHSLSVYAEGLRYSTDRILLRARKPVEN
ncbi:MAG: putative methyltransferase [Planctomycetota bacterium]|jgi:predicted methyltransferase